MPVSPARSGFSLIEALVVLAIGGMALAIIFSIGVKAGDTGFGLGRRAMTAADGDIALSDLRSLVRSLAVRPQVTFAEGVDRPIEGFADRLEAEVVMERATRCAPQGWSGRMVLSIQPRGTEHLLVCSAGGRDTTLIVTRRAPPAFSYSLDGLTWSGTYTNAPNGTESYETQRSVRLFVRVSAGSELDVIETVSSGRVQPWGRPDALG